MGLKLGNTSIGTLYLGATRIHEAYLGNVKLFESDWINPNPLNLPAYTMRFQFEDSSYDPTQFSWKSGATWTQVTSSPNVWDYTRENPSWNLEFESKFTSARNNVSVLGANFSSITDASYMFQYCTAITDTAYFDTSHADTDYMFRGCSSLLSAPSYKIGASGMGMYMGCTSLVSVGMLNTTNTTSARSMFAGCSALTSIQQLNLSHLQDASYMFKGCSALVTVPNFTTGNLLNCTGMFDGDTHLTAIPDINVRTVSTAYQMFRNCSALYTLPTTLDWYSLSDASGMFLGCTSITAVPSTWDFYSITNASSMFSQCSSLTSLSSAFNFSNVTNASGAFSYCTSLTDISNIVTTSALTDASSMFRDTPVTSIPSSLVTSGVTNAEEMFYCSTSGPRGALTAIPLLDTSSMQNVSYMFKFQHEVTGGALALYNQMSTQSNPPSSHTGTFSSCGSSTESGQNDLDHIPTSWGGLYPGVPKYTLVYLSNPTNASSVYSGSQWAVRQADGTTHFYDGEAYTGGTTHSTPYTWTYLGSFDTSVLYTSYLENSNIGGIKIRRINGLANGISLKEIVSSTQGNNYPMAASVVLIDFDGNVIASSSTSSFYDWQQVSISPQGVITWTGGGDEELG